MTRYIDGHRDRFGVEPICQALAVAPSTYYAAKVRPPSKRSQDDAKLKPEIKRVHAGNFAVYGTRKVWRQLGREGVEVGRDRVARLMAELGLSGVMRTKRVRTTTPAPVSQRPADLVDRVFTAQAPDRLWVADLTYVWTRAGFSIPLLMTVPGVGWVLAYTITSEIGDIHRFASPKKLVGYTGLCPLVRQSGGRDVRGPLAKNGPKYLRWALIEAAIHAARHPHYKERYERTKHRLGRQRGAKVARVDLGRQLATAIWHILTKNEPFAPVGPAICLVA